MYTQFHGEVQHGKAVDNTIREYFPDYSYKGVFFDVGAYEPVNISNSYHFEKNDWDVYCFEANTLLIEELKRQRKNVYNYAIYNENKDEVVFNIVKAGYGGGSGTAGISAIDLNPKYLATFGSGIKDRDIIKVSVPQKTLNTILETEIPNVIKIDIMSIDVEGGELNVLKGLNLEKYKPTLIVAENVFNERDIYDYLIQHGYKLDKQIDYNQYYLRIIS
jgi:FkbM family methyltransferase